MIRNIFRLKNELVITLDDGIEYKLNFCTDENYEKVLAIQESLYDNKAIKAVLDEIFYPEQVAKKEKYKCIKKSSILTLRNGSAYILSISKLSVPQLLVDKIIEAESANNENALTAYKNFWTLLSLNPNSAVRDNLFWFLDKWGMSICKSGLFVAYRNVDLKSQGVKYNQTITDIVSRSYYSIKGDNKNPRDYNLVNRKNKYIVTQNINKDDINLGNLADLYANIIFTDGNAGTVYTDNHTKTFEIRLGHIVSMPRKDCDETQISCSRGLHAGAKGWLKQSYCGDIGLKVLINPSDVVSVPRVSDYGKMRCCAYYPMQIIHFNDSKDVDDKVLNDGFEVDFLNKICYTGKVNNEDNDNYKLDLPKDVECVEDVYNRLKNIALTIDRKV